MIARALGSASQIGDREKPHGINYKEKKNMIN
jgi:hypothetical protein